MYCYFRNYLGRKATVSVSAAYRRQNGQIDTKTKVIYFFPLSYQVYYDVIVAVLPVPGVHQ